MKKTLQDLLAALSEIFPDIPFDVSFWDGQTEHYGDGKPVFTLGFNNKTAAKRLLSRGSMGFGEEYAAGNIDVQGDFQKLVRIGIDPRFQNIKLSPLTKASVFFAHMASLNTIRRAPANISHHYDLGDDFYKCYLDKTMAYSCAYFRDRTDTLDDAQAQKYEHICRKLQLERGESLIDIGCGWGGMLIYAARHYGVTGVGCTISPNQARYARDKIAAEGLTDKITILQADYRNIEGQFDKFVSIGMFEHVGKGFIPLFMRKARTLLKAKGIGLLHTIGKEEDTAFDPWTMKYIFPGGHIPLLDHIVRTMGKEKLVPVDIENLRIHYAATLDEWGKRFEDNRHKITEMFDEKLVRIWRLFLNGSAAAFRWGDIRLYQILFTNGLNNSIPWTREHIYRP
ncbi:MAG: Cyclopropane-fatty-acyl-phospholipid synthase [Deltaproteobacteria bacterium]|nr:Cyclopropane-fatty-acyl-phospholipid synthase [Deltaproteobacteria bacterium]